MATTAGIEVMSTEQQPPMSVAEFEKKIQKVLSGIRTIQGIDVKLMMLESLWSDTYFTEGCKNFTLIEVRTCLNQVASVTVNVAASLTNFKDNSVISHRARVLGIMVIEFVEHIKDSALLCNLRSELMFAVKILHPAVFEVSEKTNWIKTQIARHFELIEDDCKQLELELLENMHQLKLNDVEKYCEILKILITKGHEKFRKNKSWCFEAFEIKTPTTTNKIKNQYQFSFLKYLEYMQMYAILLYKEKTSHVEILLWNRYLTLVVIYELWSKTQSFFIHWPFWKEARSASKYLLKISLPSLLNIELVNSFYPKPKELKSYSTKKSTYESTGTEIPDKRGDLMFTEKIYMLAQAGLVLTGNTPRTHKPYKDVDTRIDVRYIRLMFCKMYVQAMSKEYKFVDELKSKHDWDKVRLVKRHLASRFKELADVFSPVHVVISRELLLTAFSLDHSPENLECLKQDFLYQSPVMEATASTSNNTYMEDNIEGIFTKLNFPSKLISDFYNMIYQPRYHPFQFCKTKNDTIDICQKLIERGGVDAIENKPLMFLHVDYEKYKDLKPMYNSDDDGIEDGYRPGERLLKNGTIVYRPRKIKKPTKKRRTKPKKRLSKMTTS